MNLQDLLYFTVAAGFNLEKNRVNLCHIPSIGTIKRYQVWSNRGQDVVTQIYSEIDPAVTKFIELSE